MTAADIRDWMRQVMTAHKLTPAAWAHRAGLAKSTVERAIREDYQFTTSLKTLRALADAVNETLPGSAMGGHVSPSQLLRVRFEVGAGVWRMMDDLALEEAPADVLVQAYPGYVQFPQWLERVVGDSMNQEYLPGSLLHVVDTIALGYAPRMGDHVIVQRSRDQGGTVERTVKEVAFGPVGMQLIARSTNPRWANHPIVLTDGEDQDHCEVQVVGLVLGAYRSRIRA